MYGLVNNAVKDCISANYGAGVWATILEQAGYSELVFANIHGQESCVGA